LCMIGNICMAKKFPSLAFFLFFWGWGGGCWIKGRLDSVFWMFFFFSCWATCSYLAGNC
jgi:hypothetical protein